MIRLLIEYVVMSFVFGYVLTFLLNKFEMRVFKELKESLVIAIVIVVLSAVASSLIVEFSLTYYWVEVLRQVIVMGAYLFVIVNFVITAYKYEILKQKNAHTVDNNEFLVSEVERLRDSNDVLKDSLRKAYERIDELKLK